MHPYIFFLILHFFCSIQLLLHLKHLLFLSFMVLSLSDFILDFFSKLQEESQLAKITRDSAKITVEQVHGLMSQVTGRSNF
jgi:hypothetical protein